MELEVGMYVRTKHNGIGKIVKYINEPTHYFFRCYKLDRNCINCEEYITEADVIQEPSHNIIDLIEVGDFVNGEKVIRIYEKGECYDGSNYGLITKTIETENDNYETIPHNHLYVSYSIKSIVTKEQFESMSYKLED